MKSTNKVARDKVRAAGPGKAAAPGRKAKKTFHPPAKPQGVILYRGPSLLTGAPVVCVATGLARKRKNPKTGKAIQTYILADSNENPTQANRSGGDSAICGDCPHRDGTCYVDLGKAPLAVYRAVKRDRYTLAEGEPTCTKGKSPGKGDRKEPWNKQRSQT